MRKAVTLSLLLTALAVLSYFTKPSDEACMVEAIQSFREKKLAYTAETLPPNIDKVVFKQVVEQKFVESIKVVDRFVYKEILQVGGEKSDRIGWGAFGRVTIQLK
jgi:hypothetical protein